MRAVDMLRRHCMLEAAGNVELSTTAREMMDRDDAPNADPPFRSVGEPLDDPIFEAGHARGNGFGT